MNTTILSQFAGFLKQIPDPRSKQGISHPFSGIFALVLLGLLARHAYIAHIVQWAANHWQQLKEPLGFESGKPPNETTISRALAKLPLDHFRQAMTAFYQLALAEKQALTVAVDGKTSKQMKDSNGEPIHLLNVFVHDLSVTIEEYCVKGEKTNESGSLKEHAPELFEKYPMVTLLTGDAVFNNRPLLQVLRDLSKDYLFCVKNNQPDMLDSVTQTFKDIGTHPPDAETAGKKRAA